MSVGEVVCMCEYGAVQCVFRTPWNLRSKLQIRKKFTCTSSFSMLEVELGYVFENCDVSNIPYDFDVLVLYLYLEHIFMHTYLTHM